MSTYVVRTMYRIFEWEMRVGAPVLGEVVANSKVDLVGEYKPTPFGGGKFTKGVKPADHKLQEACSGIRNNSARSLIV